MTYEDYIKAHEARLYAEYHQGGWADEVEFDTFCLISFNEYKANTVTSESYQNVSAHIGGDLDYYHEQEMEEFALEESEARRTMEQYYSHREQH